MVNTQHAVDPVTARSSSVPIALLALAMGGFAIGTTEFVTMGILPDIAAAIGRSEPTTAHLISAYAFGVVVGAPLIVSLGARLPKRFFAVALVLGLAFGNVLTALASSYLPLLVARFIAGLPHGAYFGVASLIAASIVAPNRRGRAVSMVMMGLSVATVIGVPAGTWLGQQLGWQAAYWAVVGIAVVAAALIYWAVPKLPGDPTASIGSELSALRRPQVLFAAAAGLVGFGGLFAMYSFIAGIVTNVTELSSSAIPWYLLAFGIGSVAGTWLAGRFTDISISATVVGGFVATCAVLLAFYWLAQSTVMAWLLVSVVGVLGSIVSIGLQVRLMESAGDAEMLGAALNHSSLNIANGLGAWLGGLVIAAGHGYQATALVGAALAAGGLVIYITGLIFARVAAPLSRGEVSE